MGHHLWKVDLLLKKFPPLKFPMKMEKKNWIAKIYKVSLPAILIQPLLHLHNMTGSLTWVSIKIGGASNLLFAMTGRELESECI